MGFVDAAVYREKISDSMYLRMMRGSLVVLCGEDAFAGSAFGGGYCISKMDTGGGRRRW